MRTLVLLLGVLALAAAAWVASGLGSGPVGSDPDVLPAPEPGAAGRPGPPAPVGASGGTSDAGTSPRVEAVPAVPRVGVWREGEAIPEPGIEDTRVPPVFDLPADDGPDWGRRLADAISRRFYVRFASEGDRQAFERLRRGAEVLPRGDVAALTPFLVDQGFEALHHRGVVWIRRLPGEGPPEGRPWPPP